MTLLDKFIIVSASVMTAVSASLMVAVLIIVNSFTSCEKPAPDPILGLWAEPYNYEPGYVFWADGTMARYLNKNTPLDTLNSIGYYEKIGDSVILFPAEGRPYFWNVEFRGLDVMKVIQRKDDKTTHFFLNREFCLDPE